MSSSYASKLRRLADWLDEHPLIAGNLNKYDSPKVTIYTDTAAEFGKLVATAGPGEKDSYNGQLEFSVYQKDDINLEDRWGNTAFSVYLHSPSGVCERIPTGEKRLRPVVVPEDTVWNPDTGRWEVEEEVYEYKCPESFIALADEK